MHLDRKVHTAEDTLHRVQQGISSYLQTPYSEGKGGCTGPQTLTKKMFITKPVTEYVTSSQKEEGVK